MATVKVTESAAPIHVDQKPKFTSLHDSLGRVIKLRTLDPLQKARVVMAVGGELAANSVYMGAFALPAASVVYIDDVGFGLPQTLSQIESMLSELGAEGMDAIEKYMLAEHEAAKAKADAASAASALSAEQAAAKN
ncbi:hypothetical protein SAMN05216178_3974 [Pseudomonas saponiphila]|uniref:Uncharacterized protein n=1 Tax=Pseudomonas saponiphila TaxID=556534 RepID=A0A1H4QZ12_9PSED|nr:hypothetical protein [Pseudomonas saponiphila]SEC24919.1 hypothetical protein SAMN05216178_3974 [Pseudomonas saponiphila]